jgi:hypothetical protein
MQGDTFRSAGELPPAAEWDALAARCPGFYLAQTHQWADTAWRLIASPRGRQLHCLTLQGGGCLVGVWPLALERSGPAHRAPARHRWQRVFGTARRGWAGPSRAHQAAVERRHQARRSRHRAERTRAHSSGRHPEWKQPVARTPTCPPPPRSLLAATRPTGWRGLPVAARRRAVLWSRQLRTRLRRLIRRGRGT